MFRPIITSIRLVFLTVKKDSGFKLLNMKVNYLRNVKNIEYEVAYVFFAKIIS